MSYGSVCSGIEAVTVAWGALGWSASWLAEIEKFPAELLAQRYPNTPNLGDMTQIANSIKSGHVAAPDILVGGTPCQAFSIAGLRDGLSDARGQLTLSFVELANAIDNKRIERGEEPAVIVWENVPGVLSSSDNAFGCFIAALAGEDEAFEPGHPPDAGKNNPFWRWNAKTSGHIPKWSQSGCIIGPKRKVAWRILNAQYFGVAQRRRRVFVVASARNDFDPTKVLLESDGMRRDIAPSRESGEAVATLTASGVGTCGADDNQAQAGHLIATFGGGNCSGEIDVSTCLTAHGYRIDFDVETFAIHGTQDPDVNAEFAHTIGRNQGQENTIVYGIPGNWIGRAPENGGNSLEPTHNISPCLTATDRHGVAYGNLVVRRLMPVECERLQGFPANWTQIHWRNADAVNCPDGPRYKAIGNSMAVPVMRWIGERIHQQLCNANS
ncbi:DNA cytosine methyltransferase [Rosenbergiella australiborealis]|uniref:DNA (cytosine-5-)-methyltransferase n=1 Tax=Rosenbergiella australiborealis TaxID=1544696 RepID=A0ABS5T356_9GAMM|nr:DNA cytosine methyltransferase [Rosenbergiella australiborealis]